MRNKMLGRFFAGLVMGLVIFVCTASVGCSRTDHVQELIIKLNGRNIQLRRQAAQALGEIKDPRAVEPLIAALKDEDSKVRMNTARALGEIKDPRAVRPLMVALKDQHSAEVRVRAAQAP